MEGDGDLNQPAQAGRVMAPVRLGHSAAHPRRATPHTDRC